MAIAREILALVFGIAANKLFSSGLSHEQVTTVLGKALQQMNKAEARAIRDGVIIGRENVTNEPMRYGLFPRIS